METTKQISNRTSQRSLLSILSQLLHCSDKQTLVGSVKLGQGEFMMIENEASAKKMIPLRFPYRMVPLDVNDEVVIFADFQNLEDRLYFKIVCVDDTNHK